MKINNLASPTVKNNNIVNNINKQSIVPECKTLAERFAKSDWHPKKLLDLGRAGTMGHNLFIVNAFAFLLGTRLITSRDKDERREIIIRDLPSIIIAVAGVDLIEKAVSKWFHKNKGFAIMVDSDKEPGFITKAFRNIFKKPNENELSGVTYSQLKNWYTYDKNLDSSTGLKGFSERLSTLGGKLKTIYSSLNDEIKGKLTNCKDNKEVIDTFTKDKTLGEQIKKALLDPKNNALKKAEMLKTWPTLIGFGLTLALLGICIPKTNIFITETIHKNRKKHEDTEHSETLKTN